MANGQPLTTGITTWLSQPFQTNMNVAGWALFTILIVSIACLWMMVVHKLTGMEEEA